MGIIITAICDKICLCLSHNQKKKVQSGKLLWNEVLWIIVFLLLLQLRALQGRQAALQALQADAERKLREEQAGAAGQYGIHRRAISQQNARPTIMSLKNIL